MPAASHRFLDPCALIFNIKSRLPSSLNNPLYVDGAGTMLLFLFNLHKDYAVNHDRFQLVLINKLINPRSIAFYPFCVISDSFKAVCLNPHTQMYRTVDESS